jgi:uncharacterized protein (TIGR03792 family)
MVVEWLDFHVPVQRQPEFIRLDAEIWTTSLATCPGYLGKEIFRRKEQPEKLSLVIRWRSRADWHAAPRPMLEATNRRFIESLGEEFPVLGCIDYDVID